VYTTGAAGVESSAGRMKEPARDLIRLPVLPKPPLFGIFLLLSPG
jgi:hypothetical protein